MLRDFFVGGDQRGKTVGLGIGDDQAIEGVASPLLVERRVCNFYERKIAKPDAEFRLNFPLHVARLQFDSFDLV